MGAIQFVGRMAERFRSTQICFGFFRGIFVSAADIGGHLPAHAAPTDHRMREVSLSASRSAKDCLRNSSSRARYNSAAVPVQSGSELDASVASRSSRRRDAEVSLALISAWVTRMPVRQWQGMPGIEAKVLMGLYPSEGTNGYVIEVFIAVLEHIGRLPWRGERGLWSEDGKKTSCRRVAVGKSTKICRHACG